MNTVVEQINSAGRAFIEFSLPMLIQSSVLIMVLILFEILLRKKIRAVFRYCIWLLVLVKLVMPPSISTPVGIGNLFGDKLTNVNLPKLEKEASDAVTIHAPLIESSQHQPYKEIEPVEKAAISLERQKEQTGIIETASMGVNIQPDSTAPAVSFTWQAVLFLGWAIVFLILLLLLLQRAIFVKGLVRQSELITGGLNDLVQSCCSQLGIKSKIILKASPNATSPAVCGLLRPSILLPQNLLSKLSKEQVKAVLFHELIHIKRGDLWVNLIQTLLQIVYFYNPFVWLANAVIRRVREQAVDEAVQVALGSEAQSYPQILVDVAKMAFKRPVLSLRLIGVVENKSALKSRISRMLSRPIPKSAKLGLVGMAAIIIIGIILLPMAKANNPVIITVSPDANSKYSSIQKAIDDASEGATIRIGPGTYHEQLTVQKPLTLEGAGWEQTTITSENRQTELKQERAKPTLLVSDSDKVTIKNLKITYPGKTIEGALLASAIIQFKDSKAEMENCVVIDSAGNGIQITEKSSVKIRGCLIAAVWSTGIEVGEKNVPASLDILDSDIRNCHYAGIRIRSGSDEVSVKNCRISGAAWHGIRYDDASPSISGCWIFKNARSGIYASGKTRAEIRNNIFYGNEMAGLSCWFQNQDNIEHNTFTANKRSGLEVLGASQPVIKNNIFYENPAGIYCSNIGSESEFAVSEGEVSPENNLFWKNDKDAVWQKLTGDPNDPLIYISLLNEQVQNYQTDPLFIDPQNLNFSLSQDSPARSKHIGAETAIGFDSPWPLQPEEAAIIPDSDTREYNKWKRPADKQSNKTDVQIEVENPDGQVKKEEVWGERLNGLRMRLTAPAGTVYSRGMSLPLVLEIQNVSDQPIPLNKLIPILIFKITDKNNNLIGTHGYLWDHLTGWENSDGVLRPGEIIQDTCFLERFRPKRFPSLSSFKLYFLLPTQKENPGKLPINEYSNPITIQLKDSPFEQTLKSADLPDKWTKDIDIVYRFGRSIFVGDVTVHIDGSRRVTSSGYPLNNPRPALIGRHQIMMEPNELDHLIQQLKEFKIERLKMDEATPPPPDIPLICLSISKGSQTFNGEYALFGPKTEPVDAFYKIMESFLAKITAKINPNVQIEVKNSAGQGEKELTEPPVWTTLLPNSPIRSLKEYRHMHEISPRPVPPLYQPVPIPACDCDIEIRRATDQKRVARIPHAEYSNGNWLTDSAIRRIGQLPDGEYLVSLCMGDKRCSNVAQFTFDPDFNPSTYPTLSLVPLEMEPGQKLPLLGMRAVGPTPQDPELTNLSIAHPKLIVDGVERNLNQIVWTGPVGPLESGIVYTIILNLDGYEPAIEPGRKHTVKAIAGKYESAPVVIPADDILSRQWDAATEVQPPKVMLEGNVKGLDGKAGVNCEVHLFGKNGERFSEFSDMNGKYSFFNVPAGEYKLACNPKGGGWPQLTIEQVLIDTNEPLMLNLSLERKYKFAGRVYYEDSKPAAGMDVALTCEDIHSKAISVEFTTADEDGRYELGGPFGYVSYIGINGGRIKGAMPELKPGVTELNYILKKNEQGRYIGFPAGQVEGKVESLTETENIPEDVRQIEKVLQQWFKACRADDIEQAKKLLSPNSQPLEQNLQITKMILQVIGDDRLMPAKVIQFEHEGITGAVTAFVTEKGFFFMGDAHFIFASLQKVEDNWLINGVAFMKPDGFEEIITSTKKQCPDAVIWQSDSYSKLTDQTNALLKQKLQAFEKTEWNQLDNAPQEAKDIAGIVRKWITAGLANDPNTFKTFYTANGRGYSERDLKEFQRFVFTAPDWLFSPMIIRISESMAEVVSHSFVIKSQYPGYGDFTAVLNVQLMKADGKWGILTFSNEAEKDVPNSIFKRKYPQGRIWYDESTPDWLKPEQPTKADVDIEALKSITETVRADYSFAEKVRTLTGDKEIFESYFPDSNEGGKALDEWWPQRNNDPDADKKNVEMVRNGLRRDKQGKQRQNRNQYITSLGSKYIWDARQQNKEAIELMYYASYDRQLAYDAVYYGLSVARDKSDKIMKRCVELCMADSSVSRILWGTEGKHNDMIQYLKPYLESDDPEIKNRAVVLEGVFKGEIDYSKWVNEQTAKRLQQGFGDKLDEIKKVLLKGNSTQRKEIFDLIRRNQVNLLFDKSFTEPLKACLTDDDPTVKEAAIGNCGILFGKGECPDDFLEIMDNLSKHWDSKVKEAVAVFVGSHWIWGVTPQNPEAIDIMYRLSSDKDRSVSYNAVYYGLSVVENKDEKIIKRLVDMAMDQTNDLGRIAWGLKRGADMQVLRKYLFTYLTPDNANVGQAGQLYREIFKEEPPGVKQKSTEQKEEKVDEQDIMFLPNLVRNAKEGTTVIVPKGIYTAPILIDKTLTLKGADANDCIFEVTMDGPAIVIDTKGKGKVTVENLTIKWQLATSDQCDHPFAVFVKDTEAYFNNCSFIPLGNYQRSPVALRAGGFTNMTVSNCRFEGYNYTVQFGEGAEGIIQDSIVLNSGHQGISLYDGANAKIIGNIIAGSKYHGLRSTGGELLVQNNLITNNSRGIYLGNKSASGIITNNIIMGNSEGISGFENSQVTITNNIFADSSYAGVDMRDSCRLTIGDNIFVNNQCGIKLIAETGKDNNAVLKNTFWKNKTVAENLELKDLLETDPQFVDVNNGDFSLKAGPAQEQKQGLNEPEVFTRIWEKWKKLEVTKSDS